MFELTSVKVVGDQATITYSQTTAVENGEDTVETLTVSHHRGAFPDGMGEMVPQTEQEWYWNIQREIAADLSALNVAANEAVDITDQVSQ